MLTSEFLGGVSRRRDEMYGYDKFNRLKEMKNTLTTDHISKLQEEGRKSSLPPWESTTKSTYTGRQPLSGVSKDMMNFQKERQRSSHFTMRADGSNIDDAIYKSSTAMDDFNQKKTEVIPALKPDRTINLADMQPRYWDDGRFGSSMYKTEFSDMAKEGARTQEMKDIKQEQNELCRHNLKYLRKTHFSLGNDKGNTDSETRFSYFNNKADAVTRCHGDDPAMLTRKMVEDERNSAVFRYGDYNVANALPSISTFNRDYNTTIKPLKVAGFIEPTKSKKGRFLERAPRQERNEVLAENNRDNGLSTTEENTKKRDAICTTLKQLFVQDDTLRNGHVSKEALIRACNCLLDPIPTAELDEILKVTRRGMAGTIDYNDFIQQYIDFDNCRLQSEVTRVASSSKENVNFDDIPGLESKDQQVITSWPPKTKSGNPLMVTSELGKEYQTTAHFKLGTDGVNPASIYHKDFYMKGYEAPDKQVRAKPPISSDVMHKSDHPEVGRSTKQMDYINFKNLCQDQVQKTMDIRDAMAAKNKLRHSLNSVHLSCDEQRHTEDRQTSIAQSSYTKHVNVTTPKPHVAERPKYRYLDTAALPYTSKTPNSEAKEAFNNLTSPGEILAQLAQVKEETNVRVKEQKKVHFKLGSDEPSRVSEAQDEFMRCRSVGDEVPSAGKKNTHDPRFNHISASKNTHDLKKNPMSWSTFETLRMNKKGYFSGQSNPVNPLHQSLKRVFLKLDPDYTGKVTKEQMKNVCSNYNIGISQHAMESLLRKCDRYEDGNVNCHVFLNNLTPQQVPDGISTAHTGSTMSNDYRPLQQRSFSEAQIRTINHMNSKPTRPQPSHLFHLDENRGNNFVSTMNQDFIQPEIQPKTWISSDVC